MMYIILACIVGAIIGITAGASGRDEPQYIQLGGMVWAVLITYPIQMAIRIFI